jgi:hypothetical protein
MNPFFEQQLLQTRRQFFGQTGIRLGGLAMASMLGQRAAAASAVHPAIPGLPHFPGKAKAVIYLHMNGGPSQLDMWDYKPNLKDQFGKDLPKSFLGERITTMTSGQGKFPVAPSKFAFAQHGQSGTWASDLFPHLYGPLPVSAAASVVPLPLGADGSHVFPPLAGEAA